MVKYDFKNKKMQNMEQQILKMNSYFTMKHIYI